MQRAAKRGFRIGALKHISKEAAATVTASWDFAVASVLRVDREQAGSSTAGIAGCRSAAFKFSHVSKAADGAAQSQERRNAPGKSDLRSLSML